MLDRNIVEEKVRDLMLDKTFTAIVESCFIGALPFNETSKKHHIRDLMGYTDAVLESLVIDGYKPQSKFDILANAIENETNPYKLNLLNKISNTCITTAMEVAKRVSEDDDLLENSSMNDILESVGLDEDERDEFNKNVSDINTDKIAEIIQDKVVDTIKAEKEEEERAVALEDRLKEALTPPDEAEDDIDTDMSEGDDLEGEDDLGEGEGDAGDLEQPDQEVDEPEGEEPELGDGELDEKGMPIEDEPAGDLAAETPDVAEPSTPEGTDVNVDNQNKEKDKKTGNGDDINININIEQDKSKDKPAKESMSKVDKAFTTFMMHRVPSDMAKAPVSLLSKITDYAIEAIIRTQDPDDDIPMEAVYMVTFSPRMEFFKREETYEDIIQEAMMQRDVALEASSLGDKPMIVSIVVYTVMETLKTLNLFTPSEAQIKNIIDNSTAKVNTSDKLAIAREEIKKKTEKLSGEVESATNFTQVEHLKRQAESIHHDLEWAAATGQFAAFESIENALDTIDFKLEQKTKEVLKDDSPIISSEIMKVAEEVQMGFEKVNRLYARNPMVSFITIDMNSAMESCNPTVVMRSNTGNIVCQTFLDLSNRHITGDSLIKAISIGAESVTTKSGKSVTITDSGQNGRRTKITI